MPILSQGSRGPDVELAQAALNFHAARTDIKLTVDGNFGDQTKARTIAFQRAAGLKDDGIIGPLTEAKLLAAVEITGEIHYLRKVPATPQTRVRSPVLGVQAFPQLTLPPLVPPRPVPRPIPRLVPQLTLSVPLLQDETTFFPPQIFRNPATPTVQIFPLTATIIQPIWHPPLVAADTSSDATREFWAKVFYQPKPVPRDLNTAKIGPYIKVGPAPHPTDPEENVFKAGGGIKIKTGIGGVHLELKGGISVLKYDPVTGQVKAGLLTLDGMLEGSF